MWLLIGLNVAYAVLLMFFTWQFLKGRRLAKADAAGLTKVSVVVPFRNEATNLPELLACLKEQNYPAEMTEWIFVDDHSEDGSREKLEAEPDPRLKIITLGLDGKGKKQALAQGIRLAAGKWMITTDADCTPPSSWISTLVGTAEHHDARMACGLVQIRSQQTMLSDFQAMETAVLQTSGAGSLLAGHPLLNTGASLCFRKDAWEELGGYSNHQHIASGDDTFQLLRFFQRYGQKVIPVIHKAATPATLPAPRFSDMLTQRIRWNGKVKHYPLSSIHLTGLLVMGAALAWLLSVLLFALGIIGWRWVLGILLTRLLGETMVLRAWRSVTGQSFSRVEIFLMSVFYPVFTMFSFIIRPFMKIEWKGRQV